MNQHQIELFRRFKIQTNIIKIKKKIVALDVFNDRDAEIQLFLHRIYECILQLETSEYDYQVEDRMRDINILILKLKNKICRNNFENQKKILTFFECNNDKLNSFPPRFWHTLRSIIISNEEEYLYMFPGIKKRVDSKEIKSIIENTGKMNISFIKSFFEKSDLSLKIYKYTLNDIGITFPKNSKKCDMKRKIIETLFLIDLKSKKNINVGLPTVILLQIFDFL